MLSVKVKKFEELISEKERTAAQLELIEETLKKALLNYKAFGSKPYSISVPFLKASMLTKEAKEEIQKAGFIFLPPFSIYDKTDPLILGFKSRN